MKKRTMSLFLVIAMILTMMPADAFASNGTNGALMFRQPDWVSSTDGTYLVPAENQKNMLLNNYDYAQTGVKDSVFFYFVDEDGKETKLSHKDVKSSDETIVVISNDYDNSDAVKLSFVNVGTTTITYTLNNQVYSVDVVVSANSNPVNPTPPPTSTQVDVSIVGNGGRFDVSGSGAVNPGNFDGYSQMFDVNTTLANSNVTISNPTSEQGWTFICWDVYDNTDRQNPVLIEDDLPTQGILNYVIPNKNILFRACWDTSTGNQGGTPSGPSATQIDVHIVGNGGQFTISGIDKPGTYDGCSRPFEKGSTLANEGVTITDPISPQGWTFTVWEVFDNTDSNNPVHIEGGLTTQQVLNYTLPNYNVLFRACWDTSTGNQGGTPSGPSATQIDVHIVGNGGQFTISGIDKPGTYDGCSRPFEKGSTLANEGVTITDPISPQGWTFTVWEVFDNTDGNNPVYIEGGLTTQQVLDYTLPNYNVLFKACWDTSTGNQGGGQMPPNALFAAVLDGGKLVVTVEDSNGQKEESLRDILTWYTPYGNTLKEALAFENTELKNVVKDGYTFTGWTVYEFQDFVWHNMPAGEELNVGDPDIEFIYFDTFEDPDTKEMLDTYLGMVLPKTLYSKDLSMEDFLALKAEKSYYAIANWKENSVGVPDSSEEEKTENTESSDDSESQGSENTNKLPKVPDVEIDGKPVEVKPMTIEDALDSGNLTKEQEENIITVAVKLNASEEEKFEVQQELGEEVGKNIEAVKYDKLIDLSVPKGTTIPKEGIYITIEDPAIKAGMNILMLHMKADGTWEEIDVVVEDGVLKGLFHSLSPVYYMEIVEKAGGWWYYDPEIDGPMTTTTTVASPKTADNNISLYFAMFALMSLSGMLYTKRRVK